MRRCSSRKCSRATQSDVAAYRWCELVIRADFEIPELERAGPGTAGDEWRVSMLSGAPAERPQREWFHQWELPDGRKWVAFARDAGGYLLRFPDLADFDIVPAARTIGIYTRPPTPAHTLRHLLLDQVMPLVAGVPDRLALHGSAVATARGAVLFLAGPGFGKSTLAALLARRGCELVSDDCCLLARAAAGFEVVPSYPGVRLGTDSLREVFGETSQDYAQVAHYTMKMRVAGEQQAELLLHQGRLPLSRIYVIASRAELEAASAVSIQRYTRRAALFDLLNYTFHLDVGDPARIRDAFHLAADIAMRHDVRRLVFPWGLSKSEAVAEAILGDRWNA